MSQFNLQSYQNKHIPPLIIRDTDNGTILYESQPKQTIFHNLVETREQTGIRKILYGGSARSGKSFAMRWEAHNQCLRFEKISGLIIRSSFPELERTHLKKIVFDLPQHYGTYNDNKKRFTYCTGSVLEFGYGDHVRDFQQYLSAEYDFIFIDELTTIPFDLVTSMFSRLTASNSGYIPFFAGGSNPGGQSHRQVKSFFIDKDFDREFPDMCNKETPYNPDAVAFIPASVHDNQKLVVKDPEVINRLKSMPEDDRKRFYEGSWELFIGQFFKKFSRGIHVIEEENYFEIPKEWRRLAGMDYGGTSCAELVTQNPKTKDFYVFNEWEELEEEGEEKAKSYKRFLNTIGEEKIITVADITLFNTYKEFGNKVPASNEYFENLGINITHVIKKRTEDVKYRVSCARQLKTLLNYKKDDNGLFIQKPKLYIFARCKRLVKTLPMLIADKNNDQDWDMYANDPHYTDAAKFALSTFDNYNELVQQITEQERQLKKADRLNRIA